MAAPIIYGPAFSTYVRTARLALEEKPASYELVDVAMMKGAHREQEHLARLAHLSEQEDRRPAERAVEHAPGEAADEAGEPGDEDHAPTVAP